MSRALHLRLTESAAADLADIWIYLAVEASEQVATRFLNKLEEAFHPLRLSPHIGVARDSLAPGLRVFFHGTYAIYYTPTDSDLIIIRVLHGARDLAAIREQGGFTE